MKKILLILALACMASAASVANAGPRNGKPGINTVCVMNDSMYGVNVSYDPFGAAAFTIYFTYQPVVQVSLSNCNTGEYHMVAPGYETGVVVIPVAGYLGTWELVARFANGGTCNVLFFVDNFPPSGNGGGSGHVNPDDQGPELMP